MFSSTYPYFQIFSKGNGFSFGKTHLFLQTKIIIGCAIKRASHVFDMGVCVKWCGFDGWNFPHGFHPRRHFGKLLRVNIYCRVGLHHSQFGQSLEIGPEEEIDHCWACPWRKDAKFLFFFGCHIVK